MTKNNKKDTMKIRLSQPNSEKPERASKNTKRPLVPKKSHIEKCAESIEIQGKNKWGELSSYQILKMLDDDF